jgi:hypothetical protein
MNKSTAKSRFLAAKKELNREERKMEAGKPNQYTTAYRKFCDAQREAGL